MNLNELNSEINLIKNIVKNLSSEQKENNKNQITEFYNLVTDIEKDVNSANDAVKQLNNLRASISTKLLNSKQKISNLIGQLKSS